MRRNNLFALVLLVCGAMALTTSCRSEESIKTYCSKQFDKMRVPHTAEEGIKKLGEGNEGRVCFEYLPQLTEVFKSGRYQNEILSAVEKMGNGYKEFEDQKDEYVALFSAALENKKTAGQVAAIIESWGMSAMGAPIVARLVDDEMPKARQKLLKAAAKLYEGKEAEIENQLVALVKADPNDQGLKTNVLATRLLSKIRSAKALPAIINMFFQKTVHGESMYQAARKAVVTIGGPQATKLLSDGLKAVAAGKEADQSLANEKVVKYSQVLGDVLDPAARKAIVQDFIIPLIPPDTQGNERALEAWQIAQINKLTFHMLTLQRLPISDPNEEGVKFVVDTLNKLILNENGQGDTTQRLHGASILAGMGTPEALKVLLDCFEKEQDERFRAPFLVPLSRALGEENFARFYKLLEVDKKEQHELVVGSAEVIGAIDWDSVRASIYVAAKCQDASPLDSTLSDEDKAKEKTARDEKEVVCLLNLLEQKDAPVRGRVSAVIAAAKPVLRGSHKTEPTVDPKADKPESSEFFRAQKLKALVLLSRKTSYGSTNDLIDRLLAFLDATDASVEKMSVHLDLRNWTLVALERLGYMNKRVYEGAKGVRGLRAMWKEMKRKKDPKYDYWKFELGIRLRAWDGRYADATK